MSLQAHHVHCRQDCLFGDFMSWLILLLHMSQMNVKCDKARSFRKSTFLVPDPTRPVLIFKRERSRRQNRKRGWVMWWRVSIELGFCRELDLRNQTLRSVGVEVGRTIWVREINVTSGGDDERNHRNSGLAFLSVVFETWDQSWRFCTGSTTMGKK
jgi:hypothetical protein